MGFFEKVKLILSNAFKAIADFIMPVIKLFMKESGRILATIAFAAVKDVANAFASASDGEKKDAAFSEIKKQLDVRKLDVKDSMINLAIEMALQKLKSL